MHAPRSFSKSIRIFGCAAALFTAPVLHAGSPYVGDVIAVQPSEKLERALDGTFAFPPSPPVPWKPDPTGFAKERLFSVPPVGIHPRILFGPDDLPRIRKEMNTHPVGVATLKTLRSQVQAGINAPETWEGKCFAALAADDLAAFQVAYQESPLDDSPPGSGFRSNIPGRRFATRWGTRNPLLVGMEAMALLALIDNDANAGSRVATAFATYARHVGPKVDAANLLPRQAFHWSSTRYLVPNEVVYGYDWSWPWMTPEQRDLLRSLLVRATVGKYTVGMDLPAHWRNWNHVGMTQSFAACLFAIEGERGDDPRGLERIYEVYRDYLTYAIDPLGTGTEGIGYQTIGIAHIVGPMLAFANRGKNLFLHPHWRLQTESWLVQAMLPFGGAWQSSGDLGNFPPSLSLLMPQKYFYPNSPGIDYVLRNHPLVEKADWDAIVRDANEAQWILPAMPGVPDTRDAAQKAAAAVVGGGLTFHDKERGFLYTRNGWGPDDVNLHVDCRVDITFANHDHADRGGFTLSALGRAWACDGYRDTESKFHNVVTIDGRGQAYFTPPGRWIEFVETPDLVTAVVDAKYPWDWQWTKSTFTDSEASLAQRGIAHFYEAGRRWMKRFPLALWEADPLPTVKAYNEGFTTRGNGDPRMWDDEDGWVLRAPWYPVQKAFRTVLFSRGKHPYVLIADDIRKDDSERLYEWRMNMPPDVAAVSILGADILLGDRTTRRVPAELRNGFQGPSDLSPSDGDRLLLVRTLNVAGPDMPTLQPIPMVATIEYRKTDDSHQFTGRSLGLGTQVVIGSRSIEPEFLILLFPHRHGSELPVTTLDAENLTVKWSDQTDTYAWSMNADGRRVFRAVP
jgi:hypothetical protein